MSKVRFHLYRYQLLPKDRFFQGDLLGPKSIDELIKQKNSIFASALSSSVAFKSQKTAIVVKQTYKDEDFQLFLVAVNRSINVETVDFNYSSADTWPKIHVAVWNSDSTQVVAIQHRPVAFQRPIVLAKILFSSIEETLARQQLVAEWEPMFEKRVFWDMIDKYQGRIKKVEFELVTPNMAGISKVLPEALKEFAKRTNTVRSVIALEADEDSALKLEKDDPMVEGLTSYTSDGGGNISVKIRGIKKVMKTSTSVKEIEIEDAELNGDASIVAEILKGLMK